MTTEQILKPEYKKAIKEDTDLKHKICKANKGHGGKPVSYRTLETWLRTDSEKLTTATTLRVIREHLELNASEILTEAKEEVGEVIQS